METQDLINELDTIVGRLLSLKKELLNREPEFPSWAQELVEKRVCLTCKAEMGPEESVVRGNHARHARAITRAIERGELSEFDAVEQGKLAPKAKSGRKAKSLAELVDEATDSEKPLKKLPRKKKGK